MFDLIYVISHVLLQVHFTKDLRLDVRLVVLQDKVHGGPRCRALVLFIPHGEGGGGGEDSGEIQGFFRTFQLVFTLQPETFYLKI